MEFYKNNPRNLYVPSNKRKLTKKQKRAQIIENLETTIKSDSEKVGGGNKELMAKFQQKIDDLRSK
jgi:ParB-like chromosome segregation protein Spo0J